jgi:hypothetical protein
MTKSLEKGIEPHIDFPHQAPRRFPFFAAHDGSEAGGGLLADCAHANRPPIVSTSDFPRDGAGWVFQKTNEVPAGFHCKWLGRLRDGFPRERGEQCLHEHIARRERPQKRASTASPLEIPVK